MVIRKQALLALALAALPALGLAQAVTPDSYPLTPSPASDVPTYLPGTVVDPSLVVPVDLSLTPGGPQGTDPGYVSPGDIFGVGTLPPGELPPVVVPTPVYLPPGSPLPNPSVEIYPPGVPLPPDVIAQLPPFPGYPGVPSEPSPGPSQPLSVYRVVSGDSLWQISSRLCGDGSRWREIYEANRNQISDPNLIYPGQEFVVPCQGGAGFAPSPVAPFQEQAPARPPGGREDLSPRILGPGMEFLSHMPLDPSSYSFTSDFGPRSPPQTQGGRQGSSNHKGVDLAAPAGTPILAAGAGRVIHSGWASGYGWSVYIRHPSGHVTRYAHMVERPSARVGQDVAGGTQIGKVGSTGNSGGNHLHFEVRLPNGEATNPEHYCRFR